MLETKLGFKQKAIYIAHDMWEEYLNLTYPLTRAEHDRRVFCIGREKTGTTSLGKCLHILGYRSFHWLHHGEEPPEGWTDYIRKRNFDALSDNPICSDRFYRQLDREFPNSRFILTVRDEDSWERSYRNFFFGPRLSPQDEEVIVAARRDYAEYNADVRQYFRGRENDFLEMNIFEGDAWKKLCAFLELPAPKRHFPHLQKGRKS